MNNTMNAVQLLAYGTPATLKYQTVPMPQAAAGELRVVIHAAAVNPLEIKLASGMLQQMMPLELPWTPGLDVSGVVDQVGEGVDGFQVGDAVYACVLAGGAYAEAITAEASLFSHKPAQLSHVEAASLASVAQSAWQTLFGQGQLEAGQRVLIHGASGGVGTLAVQLAHWKNAFVIASASPDNADFLRGLGANQVLDSRDSAALAALEPVDLVADSVGGEGQQALYALIKPGGRLISLPQPPAPEAAQAHRVQASMLHVQPSGEELRLFEAVLNAGSVKPEVAQTFALQDAEAAWARQLQPGVRGKIVLVVQSGE